MLLPVLPDNPSALPTSTRCPSRTLTEPCLRCKYTPMVPSLCSTLTKLPDGLVPRPLCPLSVFTTTPPRAAMIGVPSGMAMSIA
ncbi:hypothetical protein D3C84_1032380 [compost metagenome]